MRKLIELRKLAIELYNGDWRQSDREELKVIFRLSEDELDIIAKIWVIMKKERIDKMDNLTQLKKNRLLQESKDKILETPLFHNDIMKMYAYIYDCTATSDTLAEIQLMETVKASLDFLVKGVKK